MIDDELRVLLSVEPSPGFEARIKARAEAPPARWLRLRPAVFAIAATLAVAVGVGLLVRAAHQSEAPGAGSPIAQRTTPVSAAPDMAMTSDPGRPSSVAVRPNGTARSNVTPPLRRRATREIPMLADGRLSAAEVQIDRAELLALRQLFASPVSGTVVDVAPPPAGDLLFIPPIAIEPLTLEVRSEGASQ